LSTKSSEKKINKPGFNSLFESYQMKNFKDYSYSFLLDLSLKRERRSDDKITCVLQARHFTEYLSWDGSSTQKTVVISLCSDRVNLTKK